MEAAVLWGAAAGQGVHNVPKSGTIITKKAVFVRNVPQSGTICTGIGTETGAEAGPEPGY